MVRHTIAPPPPETHTHTHTHKPVFLWFLCYISSFYSFLLCGGGGLALPNHRWPWKRLHGSSEEKKPWEPPLVFSAVLLGTAIYFFMLFLSSASLWILAFQLLSDRIFVFQITFPGHSSFYFALVEFHFISCPNFNLPKSNRMISKSLLFKATPPNLVSSVHLIISLFTRQDSTSIQ